jgi:hypothetical protein
MVLKFEKLIIILIIFFSGIYQSLPFFFHSYGPSGWLYNDTDLYLFCGYVENRYVYVFNYMLPILLLLSLNIVLTLKIRKLRSY